MRDIMKRDLLLNGVVCRAVERRRTNNHKKGRGKGFTSSYNEYSVFFEGGRSELWPCGKFHDTAICPDCSKKVGKCICEVK